MDYKLIIVTTVLVLSILLTHIQATEPQLPCAPCGSVQCGTPPTDCELDRIPCGCCQSCVRTAGQLCEAFAPRCGYGLKCLTPSGLFDGRPQWYKQFLKGVCVKDPLATTAAPPHVNMQAVGRK